MDPLVRASLGVRATIRSGYGLCSACALSAYVVLGGGQVAFGLAQGLAVTCWALLLASRTFRKLRDPGEAGLLLDVEIGVLLAVGLVAALIRLDGGLSGKLAPSLYVLVAFVAAFARP